MARLTLSEAAVHLGVSTRTLRRRIKEGPKRKVGRAWLFHKPHLVEWLKGNQEGGKEM